MPFLPLFYDPTFLLILAGMALASLATANMNRTFAHFSRFESKRGYTGAQVAEYILKEGGIHNVKIQPIEGDLTDNYNPDRKTLSLSRPVYGRTSVTAIGVAAHECGHALQDRDGYFFLKFRRAIVPMVNIGSTAAFPILIIGALMGYNQTLIHLGIFLFSFALIFQIVTLPVEFDASNRALAILESSPMLTSDELPYVRKTLQAAALTYVAAAFASALSLLRVVLLFGGRGNSRN